jgi:hypothetical protein
MWSPAIGEYHKNNSIRPDQPELEHAVQQIRDFNAKSKNPLIGTGKHGII